MNTIYDLNNTKQYTLFNISDTPYNI